MDRETMSEIRELKNRIRSLEQMLTTLCQVVRDLDARTRHVQVATDAAVQAGVRK